MCELFAMSSHLPAGVDLCLAEFARHGRATGPHKDGWGIANYANDGAVRLYKEAESAGESEWVEFIETHNMRSTIVLSHIRRATQGKPSLMNTQPFRRELGGNCHVFAHNGDLPDIQHNPGFPLGFHRPIGDTDSEHAFCSLLFRLEKLWLESTGPPDLEGRLAVVVAFARSLALLGMANFIYSDGDAVFAHGNTRRERTTDPPRPPGLWLLHRTERTSPLCLSTGGLRILAEPGGREMTLVASVPLTDEDWQPLAEGELVVLRRGSVVAPNTP
jgi:predicted glutamine amidotransferase